MDVERRGANKNIFISGTTKGLGRELALRFLQNGHTVFGCSRSPSRINADGYHHFMADLSREDDLKSAFMSIKAKYKYIDTLICNAAIASMNHFMLTPPQVSRDIFDINVFSVISLLREGGKMMMNSPHGYGRIITLSSVSVYHALEGELAYSASKAAVESLTRTASKELSSANITVNCIRLPYLRTSMSRPVGSDRIKSLIGRQTIKRQCEFDDVYFAVEFLASEHAGFITGETLNLGGV